MHSKVTEPYIYQYPFPPNSPPFSNIFFDPSPRVTKIKTKINQRGLIKFESLCSAKETLNKMKRQSTEWNIWKQINQQQINLQNIQTAHAAQYTTSSISICLFWAFRSHPYIRYCKWCYSNINVHAHVHFSACVFFRCTPGSKIAGLCDVPFLTFWGNSMLLSMVVASIYSPNSASGFSVLIFVNSCS